MIVKNNCIYFLFLSAEGPMLETLDYILSVLAVHRPFYILICISTLPTQHTTFILIKYELRIPYMSVVHQPFYILIYISTLPTAYCFYDFYV